MNNTTSSHYRPEIDGLRAIAVSAVVVYHFFPIILPSGYLGVDIFFVISGFLITQHLLHVLYSSDSTGLMRAFYIRRIKRLFPALFVCLTLTTIASSILFLHIDFERFSSSLVAAYTFWANIFFWRDGGYFGGDDQLKPLLHIWSLSVEEQFYLVFPLLLVITSRVRVVHSHLSLFVFLGLLLAVSFGLWLYLNSIGGSNPAFFLLPTRMWQFGLGATLAALSSLDRFGRGRECDPVVFAPVLGGILMGWGLVGTGGSTSQTILVSLGTVIFIAYSDTRLPNLLRAVKSRAFVYVGKISYSWYLSHWPIAVFLTYAHIDSVPVWVSLFGLLASFILAALCHRFIELPFRHHFATRSVLALLFLCALISALVVAFRPESSKFHEANGIAASKGTNYRCPISSMETYASSRACVFGDATTQSRIAVLGNSHAQMYMPLIRDSVPAGSSVILIPLNRCMPTVAINVSQECIRKASVNLDVVLHDESISHVFIGGTWYEDIYVNNEGGYEDRSSLIPAYDDLIAQIHSARKTAILFSPIFLPSKNIASELSRGLRFGSLKLEDLGEELKAPRRYYDQQFGATNAHFATKLGSQYVKVFEDLCSSDHCYFGDGLTSYFADDNHLAERFFPLAVASKASIQRVFQ